MFVILEACVTILRCQHRILHQTLTHMSTKSFPGEKVLVDGKSIHYEKFGTGDHAVLCMPGALGSSRTDFSPQLAMLNRGKLTVVGWDPPGYGHSFPPERNFSNDFFHDDAKTAVDLMNVLGFPRFSVLGWSDGGITALIMAGKYPEAIRSIVVWGSNAYVTKKDIDIYTSIRNIDKWSERMKAPMIAMYGEAAFRTMWENWCDTISAMNHQEPGDICKSEVANITCPTYIIHGAKDAMVPQEHPDYLHQHIKHSKLLVMPEGKHNLHLRYSDEFNKLVEDFLLTKN